MKLTRLTKLALAAGLTVSVSMTGCKGDDDGDPIGDGDGGDGDSSGDGDSTPGDGDGSGGATGDGDGDMAASCTPGETKCAGDVVIETCLNDGETWHATNCEAGCADDACIAPPIVCTPGEGTCSDSGARITCTADGAGYEEVDCPAGAPCVDGQCVGTVCNVGDTRCDPALAIGSGWFEGYGGGTLAVVERCVDGSAWVREPCADGTVCTYDRVEPYDPIQVAAAAAEYYHNPFSGGEPPQPPEILPGAQAECRQVECLANWPDYGEIFYGNTPDEDIFTCGDPDDAGVDKDMYFSECSHVAPYGVGQWVTQACGLGVCSGNLAAPCDVDCTPGATRCNGERHIQTCDDQGQWQDSELCTDDQNVLQTCIEEPMLSNGLRTAHCTDDPCKPILEDIWYNAYGLSGLDELGVCVNGQVAYCDEDGQLQDAVDCAIGGCEVNDSWYASYGYGFAFGACETICDPGEQECFANGIRTCAADGTWGDAVSCGEDTCYDPADADPICGECSPGAVRCDEAGGETCGSDAMWSDPVACTFGECTVYSGELVCQGECVPGEMECGGTGDSETRTCGSNGLWGDYTACADGTSCKIARGANGNTDVNDAIVLGCVECVGPNYGGNWYEGMTDTMCGEGGGLQTCQADNTWSDEATCANGCVDVGTVVNARYTSYYMECAPAPVLTLSD